MECLEEELDDDVAGVNVAFLALLLEVSSGVDSVFAL